MVGMLYFECVERSAANISGPVNSRAVFADAGDVHLQLAGDALLEVDDPQRLISTDFDSSELKGNSVNLISIVLKITK